MTCKVRRDFKIIRDELSHVSRLFHWWHRTFGDLRFVPQNLYIRKHVRRFWESWRQLSKQARRRFQGPHLSYPACYDLSVRRVSTASSHPHRRHHQGEGRRRTQLKWTFRVATIIAQWIINDCYIFLPYLRVWVFLFLRTSFFKAQHVGPMLQCYPMSISKLSKCHLGIISVIW